MASTAEQSGRKVTELDELTVLQVRDFAIVSIAVMGFIVLLGNVIKVFKEWRKPGMSEAEWRRDVDDKLDRDNKRIASLEDGNRAICKALMALLSHEINGNSTDKLQSALTALSDYLIER